MARKKRTDQKLLSALESELAKKRIASQKKTPLDDLCEKLAKNPNRKISQEQFAMMLQVHPSVVSRLRTRGILSQEGIWIIWLSEYRAYHKGLRAGRRGSGYYPGNYGTDSEGD